MQERNVQDRLERIFDKHEDNETLQRDLLAVVKAVTSAVTRKADTYFRLREQLKAKYADNAEALEDIKEVVSITLDLVSVAVAELAPTLTKEAA